MTGERRLHGDACGLDVTNLTDEDHVGVLAQDRLEPGGERHARLLADLDLVDLREDVLDRVFDRHHVDVGAVDLRQRRVERGGLAAAGRTADDDHAVRRVDEPRVELFGVGRHAEVAEPVERTGAVEQPEHGLLAPDRATWSRHARRGARPSMFISN